MKLQKKIILMFMTFMMVMGVTVALIDYGFTMHALDSHERERLLLDAKQYVSQFDTVYREMANVPLLLLSENDFRIAVQELARLNKNDIENKKNAAMIKDDLATIGSGLAMDYLVRNFSRVIFFTETGLFKAGSDVMGRRVDNTVHTEDLHWLKDSPGWGESYLVSVHQDDWSKAEQQVVSLVKRLGYTNGLYIEVQKSVEDLDSIFNVDSSLEKLYLCDRTGRLLYSPEPIEEYLDTEQIINDPKRMKNGRMVLVKSEQADVQLLLIGQKSMSGTAILSVLPMLLVTIGTMFLFTLFYSRFSADNISRPIRSLQQYVEKKDIDNLDNETFKKQVFPIKEVSSLYESFRQMESRLGISMQREKRLSGLQLQAQLDLLQAQVNPHFLYNVLTVLSYKGILAGDESISDICVALGKMLRYSTDTREKMATVREELHYLELYFHLLKERYEDRLEYMIRVDDNILDQIIPKIVFQQIVENSINHGYTGGSQKIRLSVEGEMKSDCWTISFHDNGKGFDPEILASVQGKCREIVSKLSYHREHVEMQIGGMGLVNIFARLYLVYGENLIFEIHSKETETCIVLGASGKYAEDTCQESAKCIK